MSSIGTTRSSDLKSRSDEIERKTQEFLKKGGKVQREEIGETKTVDLTWRNYASAAMLEGEEE
jgi:hypothetical protein